MALGKGYQNQHCGMARALEEVGERWTLLIVRDAFYGVRRYSDFLAHLEMPRAVLAERLHALTELGVFVKRTGPDAPRGEYELTDRGLALWPVLAALSAWAAQELTDLAAAVYEHAPCGGALPDRMTCATCGGMVRLEDIIVAPGITMDMTRTDPVSIAMRQPRRLLTPIR